MPTIQCFDCNEKIYPRADEDLQRFAANQNWSYRFNFLSKKEDKNEFRCPACTQKRLEEMQKNMGFKDLSPRPAGATSAASKTFKPIEKPLPPPRPFLRAMDSKTIGEIYRDKFGGGSGMFSRTTPGRINR